KARSRGIGGHRRGGVAGGDARHARHLQSPGLRDSAGHAVVLERSGGIESLMLEGEAVETAIRRGNGAVEHRRVSFAQRDYVRYVVQKGEQLAVAPDSALIERIVGQAAA